MIVDITDNDELLRKLSEGNESAFASIFDQYHRLLYSLAYRYFKSTANAEDAVQYTFMRLWEQHATFDYSSGVRSLLFTILKNYILNELRHQKIVYEKEYEIVQNNNYSDSNFTDLLEDNDFKWHLHEVIQQLPPQQRQICLLKMDQGLTNQEIADKMQISIPTVKSHYTQALKYLRLRINKLFLWINLMFICI